MTAEITVLLYTQFLDTQVLPTPDSFRSRLEHLVDRQQLVLDADISHSLGMLYMGMISSIFRSSISHNVGVCHGLLFVESNAVIFASTSSGRGALREMRIFLFSRVPKNDRGCYLTRQVLDKLYEDPARLGVKKAHIDTALSKVNFVWWQESVTNDGQARIKFETEIRASLVFESSHLPDEYMFHGPHHIIRSATYISECFLIISL